MKTFYKAILFVVFTTISTETWSQDIGFSQYYDQPFQRNPALAGIFTGDLRLVASFRNQWQSVTVPYRTYGLSGELKLPLNFVSGDNFTVGLQLMEDVAGTSQYKTSQILPAVNYSLPLSQETNSYLSIGLMGGLRHLGFNSTGLVLNDQFLSTGNGAFVVLPASRQLFTNTSVSYFDFSAGLSYNGAVSNADYYIGAGMFHITSPQIGFFDQNEVLLHKKFTLNMGLSAPMGEDGQLMIYGDYFTQVTDKFKKIGISSIQAGMMFNYNLFLLGEDQKSFTVGAIYRLDDAIIPVAKLEINNFNFGLSYDVNISKLKAASYGRGGVELTLCYKRSLNYRNSELRQTLCPRFGRSAY
jgi:type IX secretion system PorP/SprF family membrane protein